MKRIVSLTLALALACGGSSARVSTHVTIAVAPSASVAIAPKPVTDPCARVRTEQRAFVKKAIADSASERPNEWSPEKQTVVLQAVLDGPTNLGVACHPFENGAWSIELQTLQLMPEYDSGSAEVVVVAYASGKRIVSDVTMRSGVGGMFTHVDSLPLTDYDHDGVPELWMHAEEEGVEGGHFEESRVLHFAIGAVENYAPASKLGVVQAPRDVDGDGLVDLPVNLDVVLGAGVECFGKADWSPAKLLAHARPDGTFSTTDAVAKSFPSSWCAAAPTKIASPEEALCARMWKLPRTLVSGSCTPWNCALETQQKPQAKNATRDCKDRLEAYDTAVPFTLP